MSKQALDKKEIYVYLASIYMSALILRPILASKILDLGGVIIPGAIVVFPLSFVCNDILSEVYGFKRTRHIICAGLICQILAILAIYLVSILPSASFWSLQGSYDSILGQSIRITFASLVGYFFGELSNSIIISNMKLVHNKNSKSLLAWRFLKSTLVGELVDSVLFMSIAFAFVYPLQKVITLIFTSWVLKTLYEVVLLPLSTLLAFKVQNKDKKEDRPTIESQAIAILN